MRRFLSQTAPDLDLVPLIDVVFLILLFFILCGRLTIQERMEQITVPPARTASAIHGPPDRLLLNIQGGERPMLSLGADGRWLDASDPATWTVMRERMDRAWDRSGKTTRDGRTVADAVVELRADGEAPYHLVQQAQQMVNDSVEPETFRPLSSGGKPFVLVELTARKP